MKDDNNKILIIDEKSEVHIMKSILEPCYHLLEASDEDEVHRILDEYIVNLIIFEMNMPAIREHDLLSYLKSSQEHKDIPVLIYTRSVDEEDEVKALRLGASDYIVKPSKKEIILARVKTQLELSTYRHRLSDIVEEKTKVIQEQQAVIFRMLSKVTEFKDEDTGNHINRTMEYVSILIDGYNKYMDNMIISVEDKKDIVVASQLHDIGKVAIPDYILLKPAKLTKEEFDLMKQHCDKGYYILKKSLTKKADNHLFKIAREVILYHHEKWNGAGYPKGIKGEQIPLCARIMAIADVFDALVSSRPYKKAYEPDEAKRIILEGKGTHFDPLLIDVFEQEYLIMKNVAIMMAS